MGIKKDRTYPIMELTWIAMLLSIVSGITDGYSYSAARAFATIQSGNVLLVGQTFAVKKWDEFVVVLCYICCFGLGAFLTVILTFFKLKKKKIGHFKF